MTSHLTRTFRKRLRALPRDVQRRARDAYRTWSADPFSRELQFKALQRRSDAWSVRIGRDYRALGLRENDEVTWFWIGSHAEYDALIQRL